MSYCPNFKGILKANYSGTMLIAVARCKMWNCPYCAEKNRKQWRATIIDHVAKSSYDWSWFTLTAHEKTHRGENASWATLENIKKAWDRLVKRMKRKYGGMSYVRVYELHNSGCFHLHCVRSGTFNDIVIRNKGKKTEYSDSNWLRKNARSLGLGYMTHADNLNESKKAVFYVTKYMTKIDTVDMQRWKGVRRIQTSRDIKRVQKEAILDWKVSTGLFVDELLEAMSKGVEIYNVTEDRVMTTDDFIDYPVYPK